ncbi:MAG: HNH endonuclease signature motif containing protein, partial [Parachlamydiaceae bacterium]|nr:HNH endonuclease signature motif containing protein [Parachlamydiaceae bacterium]
LQEGTPLNKAEKLNAFRGFFKDTFCDVRESHPLFTFLGNDKRFRLRQLSAELLAVELESDFEIKVFPSLDLANMMVIIKKYEKTISKKKVSFYKGNLDFLHQSLNLILTALQPRELTTFYLLISFLRKKKADNYDLLNEFSEFAKEFMKNLNSFSIYDINPPDGMDKDIFDSYKKYKLEAKIMTTSSSIKNRFDIVLDEYKRLRPFIEKDVERLHDTEQKRILYFKQKGLCAECSKEMHFKNASSHHVIAHSKGGNTNDLKHAILLHERCHQKLEKRLRKDGESLFDKT